MKYWLLAAGAWLVGGTLLMAAPAQAALPELKLSPLQYTEHLELGKPKIGFIEASNPTSTSMKVGVEVQAFRQTANTGALEYYNDDRLAAAITPGLTSFELGPREAVRLKFTVDPNKLGPGGAYGVIFLRVSSGTDAASQINTSARIGTLLMLDVAGAGTKSGRVQSIQAPAVVVGASPLAFNILYGNEGRGTKALAYTPALQYRLGYSGRFRSAPGPFVFPGRARAKSFTLAPGNRLGVVPLTVRDTTTGHSATHWILLITGVWVWLLPLLLAGMASASFIWYRRR